MYVTDELVQIFSGSNAVITFVPDDLACAAGQSWTDVLVKVADVRGNIMPAGTTIEFRSDLDPTNAEDTNFPTVNPSLVTVPNVVYGIGQQMIVPTTMVTVPCNGRNLTVTVTTPNKVQTMERKPIRVLP